MTTWDEIQEKRMGKFMARAKADPKKQFRYQNRRVWQQKVLSAQATRGTISDMFNLKKVIRGVKSRAQIELERERKKQGVKLPKMQEAYQDFNQDFRVRATE